MDAQYISTANLKRDSLIQGNVEDSILKVVIQRVQRGVVRPLLGTSLYKRLVAGIDAADLNTDEDTLMTDYVHPLMVVACERLAIDAVNYQIRNKAVSVGTDADFRAVSESENLRLDNSVRPYIDAEQNTLIGYLLDNCTLYPEYDNAECSYENKPPSTLKRTGSNFNLV